MKATLELHNLSIGYGKKCVAEHLNAALHPGELTCLLGVNGAGKSTLLRTVAAFQPALAGEMTLNGKSIKEMPPRERARNIGVVLTERTDLQNMTVRELVEMGRAPYTGFWGTVDNNDLKIVDDAIESMGIASLSHRMIQTLSDGERQKVMIAKALAQGTPVIILDEPTAFLDFPSKVETMQTLLRLCHEMHKTVLLSTHDVELALQLSDQLWLLSKSEQLPLVTGTPSELASSGHISRFVERDGIVFHADNMTLTVDNQ